VAFPGSSKVRFVTPRFLEEVVVVVVSKCVVNQLGGFPGSPVPVTW